MTGAASKEPGAPASATIRAGLSKSRILSGLQCAKRLWLEAYRREEAVYAPAAELVLAAGNVVGEVARRLCPGGVFIGHVDDLPAALGETRGAPALFEPAFEHRGVLVRADILERDGGRFRVIEVKSSTSVKDTHLMDAAVQSWVLAGAGLDVSQVLVRRIDSGFVYPGGERYEGLFRDEDVTGRIAPLVPQVADWVDRFRAVLEGAEPAIEMGRQCSSPFNCPFQAYCGRELPPVEYPVSLLPNGTRLAAKLAAEGIADLRDVPAERLRNANDRRIWAVTRSGEPQLLPIAAKKLEAMAWPRFFLDFEGIAFAVPRWAGTRPYQHLPFQWSCHVETREGRLAHHEWLDTTGEAPMRAAVRRLLAVLGRSGTIFVYNRQYEAMLLKDAAKLFPDLAADIAQAIARIEDLLPLTRESYYHPAMKGSWSLKAVLPTLDPALAYDTLGEVREGQGAQAAYLELIDPGTGAERKAELAGHLREYCKRDTLGLYALYRRLASAQGST